MKLLYRTAEWHAFAKMRLHTNTTLKHLAGLTTELGKLMRDFEHNICSQFRTFELPRELEARKRREEALRSGAVDSTAASSNPGRKPKTFNLFTYKWHALGDYVRTIRLFGGSDGFSSQLVSSLSASRLHRSFTLITHCTGRTLPPSGKTALQAYQQAQCS